MKIGITYDLKTDLPEPALAPLGLPDDHHEEFDSPATIEAIASVFRSLGHEVDFLGDGRDLIRKVLDDPPDLVFNFAEGQGIGRSREARVPAVLEMLGIPYTGSDPLTMAATLDKDCAKRLVASAGVAVPRAVVLSQTRQRRGRPDPLADAVGLDGLPYPVVVKPAWEGSSKGIRARCLVKSPDKLPEVVDWLLREQRQPVLVEEYIEGDELTVGVIGNQPPRVLGVMRVAPIQPSEHFIYGLEIKRDYRRLVHYECPAPLSADVIACVEQAALTAFDVLGCRDVSRVDFRLRDGVPYFLEVNPLPGLNPEDSDLVIMARLLGWSYDRLVVSILDAAMTRLGMKESCSTPKEEELVAAASIEN